MLSCRVSVSLACPDFRKPNHCRHSGERCETLQCTQAERVCVCVCVTSLSTGSTTESCRNFTMTNFSSNWRFFLYVSFTTFKSTVRRDISSWARAETTATAVASLMSARSRGILRLSGRYWPSPGWCRPGTDCASCTGHRLRGRASTAPAPGWGPQAQHPTRSSRKSSLKENGGRGKRPPTVSEWAPSRLHCSELYELNRTPPSSHQDTWAARKHLSSDKHTGYTQVMREGPGDDGT